MYRNWKHYWDEKENKMDKKKKLDWKRKEVSYPIVKVKHVRATNKFGYVLPMGGLTVVEVEAEKGVYFVGVSFCWVLEHYNKRKGKSIAAGRVTRALLHNGDAGYNYETIIKISVGKIDEELYENAKWGRKPVDPVKEYGPGENNE